MTVIVPAHRRPHDPTKVLHPKVFANLTDKQIAEIAWIEANVLLGLSAAGMLRWAITEPASPYHGAWPADRGDLERCELAHQLAPVWLQERTNDLLEQFRSKVNAPRT